MTTSFNEKMTLLADAIRAKAGVSGSLTLGSMKDAVLAIQQGTGAGDSSVKFGYYTEDGKFQAQNLTGDTPTSSGSPVEANAVIFSTGLPTPEYTGGVELPEGITVQQSDVLDSVYYIDGNGEKQVGTMTNHGAINVTLQEVPQSLDSGYYERIDIPACTSNGGGIEFYECTAYTPDFAGGFEYTMNITAADKAEAIGEYKRTKYIDPIDESIEEYPGNTAVWEKTDGSGVKLTENYSYGAYYYSFVGGDGYDIYYQDSSEWSRVTDYNKISWVDTDAWEPASVTFSDWIATELPPTTEGWNGYKMTRGGNGLWVRTDEFKENMTAPGYTPQVGGIYSEDTSIAIRAMATSASQSLVALYHFDGDYIDVTGNTTATMYEKDLDGSGYFGGCLYGDTYNTVIADSSYYMQIINLPALDAFTVEWWQKDDDSYGDGGAFLLQPETDDFPRSTFLTVPILKDDKRYIQGRWKHLAFVREAGSSTVTQYLNGENVGTVEFSDILGGRTVNFSGLAPTTGQAKTIRIDELAFYGAVKYTGNFTPPDVPIIM